MRLDFLCPQQRAQFKDNPEAARDLWQQTSIDMAMPVSDPTPYQVARAGAALEAAHIYLRAEPKLAPPLYESYAATALTLIRMLTSLGQSRLGIVVLAVSNALIEDLSHRGTGTEAALRACRRITSEGMGLVSHRYEPPTENRSQPAYHTIDGAR